MGRRIDFSYLALIKRRYKKADRKKKTMILADFCEDFGYNRKYAIRVLNQKLMRPKKRPGPKKVYDPKELLKPLKQIWFATDQMCSKRLKAALHAWLPFYEAEHGKLSEDVKSKLLTLSAATIDRMLAPIRFKRKGLTSTKPGTLLKNKIPIRTGPWDVTKPGFMEADSVAHGGNSTLGSFVWSITLTDIFSGWTENGAVWNKGANGVLKRIEAIEKELPFDLLGFDCDNGSEFLNHHLWRYFTERKRMPVYFTRSRPYKKNDNAHVEQKNWTHVRQLLGYDRFDKIEIVPLINDLYKTWSLYQNYFCPTFKLKSKIKINSKYKKTYETPKTPYKRLLESEHINEEIKERLRATYATLNPFSLKKDIEKKLKKIFNELRKPIYEVITTQKQTAYGYLFP